MRKYISYAIVLLALTFSSCQNDDVIQPEPGPNTGQNPGLPVDDDTYVKQGVITIKLTPQAGEKFEPVATRSGSVNTGVPSIDLLNEQLGVTHIERTFRHGGKFEPKMRKHGLHLWYNVYFDEKKPTTRALVDYSTLPDLEIAHPVIKAKRIKSGPITPVSPEQLKTLQTRSAGTIKKVTEPFNDPLLGLQWHYHNEGLVRESRPGADINLYKAWEIETGKPQVIVAIIDGGIQTDHPDLVANLWVNRAEKNGTAKVDDDGNGYVDDVHGFNFVTNRGKIVAHDHGTHVAGTVAAVNNNNVGVGGVAGGDGTPNSGIRLMSCQIFQTDETTGGDESMLDEKRGDVFIYAANNGAVIAQCSWSYGWAGADQEIMPSDKAGIEYFMAEAGTDENGNQTGPMVGGVVIVATGNDDVNAIKQPAAYPGVVSVASYRADFQKAVYSNYGTWVTLSGPGGEGDYEAGTQILSTMRGSQYGYQAGTSMACPHVSGVAALIVSKYGIDASGQFTGFTNNDLKAALNNSTNDVIDWFNPVAFQGKMGKGFVNAHKALAEPGTNPPDRVSDITVDWSIETATAKWRVTADPEEGKAAYYQLVVSEENITGIDFTQLPASLTPVKVEVGSKNVGDQLSQVLTGLEKDKTYYVSIAGYDASGNVSLSSTVSGGLVENQAPHVLNELPVISVRKTDNTVYHYELQVADPEGFTWDYRYDAGSPAISIARKNDLLIISAQGSKATPGDYKLILTLTDQQGESREVEIAYSVTSYAPNVVKEFEDVTFRESGSRTYNLADHFVDKDNDPITFSVASSNPEAISAEVSGTTLTVTAVTFGASEITVTAKDVNMETKALFKADYLDASREVSLYPLPVRNDGVLNIRMSEYASGKADISIYTLSGARIFNQEIEFTAGTPATLDISSVRTGNYQIVIRHKGNTITRNFTKL